MPSDRTEGKTGDGMEEEKEKGTKKEHQNQCTLCGKRLKSWKHQLCKECRTRVDAEKGWEKRLAILESAELNGSAWLDPGERSWSREEDEAWTRENDARWKRALDALGALENARRSAHRREQREGRRVLPFSAFPHDMFDAGVLEAEPYDDAPPPGSEREPQEPRKRGRPPRPDRRNAKLVRPKHGYCLFCDHVDGKDQTVTCGVFGRYVATVDELAGVGRKEPMKEPAWCPLEDGDKRIVALPRYGPTYTTYPAPRASTKKGERPSCFGSRHVEGYELCWRDAGCDHRLDCVDAWQRSQWVARRWRAA